MSNIKKLSLKKVLVSLSLTALATGSTLATGASTANSIAQNSNPAGIAQPQIAEPNSPKAQKDILREVPSTDGQTQDLIIQFTAESGEYDLLALGQLIPAYNTEKLLPRQMKLRLDTISEEVLGNKIILTEEGQSPRNAKAIKL